MNHCHDLPSFHYPQILGPHRKKREVFISYGSGGATNVYETKATTGDMEICVLCQRLQRQKSPQWHHDGEESLCAALPSLPLNPPNKVVDLFKEPCLSGLKGQQLHLSKLLTRMKFAKGKMKLPKIYGVEEEVKGCYSRVKELYERDITNEKSEESSKNPRYLPVSEKNPMASEDGDEDEDDDEDSSGSLGLRQSVDGWAEVRNPSSLNTNMIRLAQMSHKFLQCDANLDMIVNSKYCGGGLSSVCISPAGAARQSHVLLYPTGPQLACLCANYVTLQDNKTVLGSPVSATLSGRIYQVQGQDVQGQGYCVTREACTCSLFRLRAADDGPVILDKISSYTPDEKLNVHMASLSPFIAGECLLAEATGRSGSVALWTDSQSPYQVCSRLYPRFQDTDTWWTCHFGAHPRQVVVGDRTGLSLHDIRSASGEQPVQLFSLPHGILHSQERVMATLQQPLRHFYHLLATDYSIVMVDQRFPNHAVLHWSHSLLTRPQYLALVPDIHLDDLAQDVLMVGTQDTPETHCFQLTTNSLSSQAPQITSAPWRLAPISDMAHMCSRQGGGARQSVIDTRLTIPLAGVCGLPHPDQHGFSALQLTSMGDLFCQDYHVESSTSAADKTHSLGPGSDVVDPLDEVTFKQCSDWLQSAEKYLHQFCQNKLPTCLHTLDVSDLFTVQDQMLFPHAKCCLCTPQPDTMHSEGQAHSQHSVCCSCQNQTDFARALHKASLQGLVSPTVDQELPALPEVIEAMAPDEHNDPISRLLCKLWQGNDDIDNELRKMDDEKTSVLQKKLQQKQHQEQQPQEAESGGELDETESGVESLDSASQADTDDRDKPVQTPGLGAEPGSDSELTPYGDLFPFRKPLSCKRHHATESQSGSPPSKGRQRLVTESQSGSPLSKGRQRHVSTSSRESNRSISSAAANAMGFLTTPPRLLKPIPLAVSSPLNEHAEIASTSQVRGQHSTRQSWEFPMFSQKALLSTPPSRVAQKTDSPKAHKKKLKRKNVMGF